MARGSTLFGPLLGWVHPYDRFSDIAHRLPAAYCPTISKRRTRGSGVAAPTVKGVVAYVLWRYPLPTETFIRREVQALRDAGMSIGVFALEPDDPPMLPDPASPPAGSVVYFGNDDVATGRRAALAWLRRRPWTLFRLWLFIVGHRDQRPTKTWWRDRDLLFLAARLASVLEDHAVVHVHAPWANHYAIVAGVAACLIDKPFSVQARASEIRRTVESHAVADRLRCASFVLTNSHYNERHLQGLLRSSGPPIHVVYNGVDCSHFVPARPDQWAAGPCRLLAVGRLVEPKGFRYLLEACHLLRERGTAFICEIIGAPVEPLDTATWVDLRMRVTAWDLSAHVSFLGAQSFSAVLEAYRRADVFVLPCVCGRDGSRDITPNSLIEAMAMRLPVVSTTSGAIPEIVESGRDGLLVAPNDATALADALEKLTHDMRLRESLGAAARETVLERFDINRNAAERVHLFESSTRAGFSSSPVPAPD